MDFDLWYEHLQWTNSECEKVPYQNGDTDNEGASASFRHSQLHLIVAALVVLFYIVAFASVLPAQASTYFCEGYAATILGTSGNDVRFGTSGRDVFVMFEGNDVVYGMGGDDIICSNQGNDTIYGGAGHDIIYGGQGRDTIYGDDGNDLISGNKGNDLVFGYAGDDEIYGNEDMDELHGDGCRWSGPTLICYKGFDRVFGGQHDDKIWGGYYTDTLNGNLGVDTIDGDGDRTTTLDNNPDYCSTGERYTNCTFIV
jgi:Ca2+-binding RTX toxin-like protein